MNNVFVPVDLLRSVLDQATQDNVSVEGEFSTCNEDHEEHDKQRALIDELRRIAGLPINDPM